MSKTYDELMKLLEEKGEIPDADAKKIIEANGPLTDDEKKSMAAAIKMRKMLDEDKKADKGKDDKAKADDAKPDDKKPDTKQDEEVSMEDYINALSILDSTDASEEEKKAAEKVKEKFES